MTTKPATLYVPQPMTPPEYRWAQLPPTPNAGHMLMTGMSPSQLGFGIACDKSAAPSPGPSVSVMTVNQMLNTTGTIPVTQGG
jgi:hypothetical protein